MTQWFVYIPAGFFFQVEFFEVNFRWNFTVNLFRFVGKISTWKKIPGGKICIFRLILLLYIAFHLYSISCEGEKNPPVFFLRFHVFKFTWMPAGRFRTGSFVKNFFLIQYFDFLCKDSERNWVSTLFSSEMYGLSIGQGLTLSPLENYQVFL